MSKKTRVLIFQTHADNSGTQELSLLLNIGLAARGYDTQELILVRGTDHLHDMPNLRVTDFPVGSGIIYHIRMAFLALKELRRAKADVILTMQWGGNMLTAFAAPFIGRPKIIASEFTPVSELPRPVQWIDALQGSMGCFARIIMNTRTVQDEYAGHSESYRARFALIEHGFRQKTTNLSKTDSRQSFGLPQGVTVLGSVGRLFTQKHFDAAIRLLPGNPSWHLALAGHGPEQESLRALANSLGVADRTHILGEVNPERIGDFLAGLDVFVFPTIAETFGLAVVEAAQAGIPVVVNDIPVMREVLAADGEPSALFVNADDTEAFARAVSQILEDETLRLKLTGSGRRLKQRYSLDRMYDDYDRLIQETLSAR